MTNGLRFGLWKRHVRVALSTLDYRFGAKNVNERGNPQGVSALGLLGLQVKWNSYGWQVFENARG